MTQTQKQKFKQQEAKAPMHAERDIRSSQTVSSGIRRGSLVFIQPVRAEF